MKQPIYPILPGFPDTESFKELSFHLKELHWDLTSLVKQVEAHRLTFLILPKRS